MKIMMLRGEEVAETPRMSRIYAAGAQYDLPAGVAMGLIKAGAARYIGPAGGEGLTEEEVAFLKCLADQSFAAEAGAQAAAAGEDAAGGGSASADDDEAMAEEVEEVDLAAAFAEYSDDELREALKASGAKVAKGDDREAMIAQLIVAEA